MSTSKPNNQTVIWDEWYSERRIADREPGQVHLARALVDARLPSKTVLDLGCGQGQDSIWLTKMGLDVIGLDISVVALSSAGQAAADAGVDVKLVHSDMSALVDFPDASFGGIFSYLSLHYFTDVVTRSIVADLARVTMRGGVLAFAVKSTKDFYYGQGAEIERDMYIRKGHVRHFFTTDYALSVLGDAWQIMSCREVEGRYENENESALIECIARRI